MRSSNLPYYDSFYTENRQFQRTKDEFNSSQKLIDRQYTPLNPGHLRYDNFNIYGSKNINFYPER